MNYADLLVYVAVWRNATCLVLGESGAAEGRQLQGGSYSSASERNCTDGVPKYDVTHLTSREYMLYIYIYIYIYIWKSTVY